MTTTEITAGSTTKKYAIITTTTSNYKVDVIDITDEELRENGIPEYGITDNERYPVFTATSCEFDSFISNLDIAEKVEIDNDTMLIRLA